MDGNPRGGADNLNALRVADIQEMRFLNAADATTRFGIENSDAVTNAFANFYNDTDGIQGQLVQTWAAVAFTRGPGLLGSLLGRQLWRSISL